MLLDGNLENSWRLCQRLVSVKVYVDIAGDNGSRLYFIIPSSPLYHQQSEARLSSSAKERACVTWRSAAAAAGNRREILQHRPGSVWCRCGSLKSRTRRTFTSDAILQQPSGQHHALGLKRYLLCVRHAGLLSASHWILRHLRVR